MSSPFIGRARRSRGLVESRLHRRRGGPLASGVSPSGGGGGVQPGITLSRDSITSGDA